MTLTALDGILTQTECERWIAAPGTLTPLDGVDGVPGFVLDGVLTEADCERLIAGAESAGFERASRNAIFAGKRQRAVVQDGGAAAALYEAIRPFLDAVTVEASTPMYVCGPGSAGPGVYDPVGVSDILRFSKYDPGDAFATHYDSVYAPEDGVTGLHTILLYLSTCGGGETKLYRDVDDHSGLNVVSVPGRALVFHHHTLHEGLAVSSGVKYVVRTEVVFRRRA